MVAAALQLVCSGQSQPLTGLKGVAAVLRGALLHEAHQELLLWRVGQREHRKLVEEVLGPLELMEVTYQLQRMGQVQLALPHSWADWAVRWGVVVRCCSCLPSPCPPIGAWTQKK